MKLRTRLFVIVGALFFVAFAISYAVEEYFTRTNLVEAEKQLESEIIHLNEMKREHFEKYLQMEISKAQAEIDAVLAKIARFPHLRDGFAPNNYNRKHHTWLNTASLKLTNQWIDFVQNLDGHQLSASVVVDEVDKNGMHYYPINDEIILAQVMNIDGKWKGPYIGVRVHYNFSEQIKLETHSAYYALFDPETLLKFDTKKAKINEVDVSLNFVDPFIKWIDVPARRSFMQVLLTNIGVAQKYIQEEISSAKTMEAWKREALYKIKSYKHSQPWTSPGENNYQIFLGERNDPNLKRYFSEIVSKYDKVGMTWGLSTLIASGAFGFTPFDTFSPKGLGHVILGEPSAEGLLTDEVFLKKPIYPESVCGNASFKKNKVPYCLPNTLELMVSSHQGLVFLGNTLYMQSQGKEGSLSIGIDSRRFLQDIARAANESTAFVSKDKIVQIVDAQGQEIEKKYWDDLPVQSMLKETTGVVQVDGKEYFYLHIQPFQKMDFHFFVFKLKAVEYELLNSINRASKLLIKRISSNVRLAGLGCLIIVLIILHYIARSITRPITRLAKATKEVAQGKLDCLEPPPKNKRRTDEIETLYHSFFEMVKGLKEKEKVRGVLNKVVSPEIAKEALEGNIHLGGEEREVTVLFGDVRHFTNLTENMSPTEVIELLNGCMTKVSHQVDEFGGVIDKYVGDEIMALFGAPVESAEAPQKALDAAFAMRYVLGEWNQERKKEGKPEVNMGFGIHTGMVLAGNMGAENRLNYTVLGSNVNRAARLCSFAGENVIVISQETYEKLGDKEKYTFEKLTDVDLKGFSHDFEVLKVELKGASPPQSPPK